jgi:serine/threonine protein kinase/tetratricopeptide (TPR) repeat protein
MEADVRRQAEEIFKTALECKPAERRELLDRLCAPGSAVRIELDSLFAHYEASRRFLEEPLAITEAVVRSQCEAPPAGAPSQIGSYRILDLLGEGGMGVVYRAEQEKPHRIVALKVVRPGIVSSTLLRRFEHEAQVLGRLQHPGIAQIFEAGVHRSETGAATANPQPFFAMEFIAGSKLTDYARQHGIGVRERLGLLARICDAVQHAHQKGIIHRDLKPDNILVDDSGQPKILDFGVARATDADVQMTTMQTDVGQLLGTAAYMSPEQVAANPDELDTRSDVYALGVIGFELLAGHLPYELHGKMIHEVARTVREEEPCRLSSINRVYRGDIETILARALEKDKERRYPSAAALAEDIRRFLRDEPIIARRPTTVYQLRKFARRHKALVVGVAAVVTVLALGVVGTSIGLYRAVSAERRARREADNAIVQAEKAETVTQFLQRMLASVDPAIARGSDVTALRQMLDDAARRAETELTQQPEVAATVRATIGTTYKALGSYDESEPHLRAALRTRRALFGNQHPDVAASMAQLASLLHAKGDYEAAEQLFRDALRTREVLFGTGHAAVATTLYELGVLLLDRSAYDDAETAFRQALRLREALFPGETQEVAASLHGLGSALEAKGHYAEADRLYREALRIKHAVFGELHPSVVRTLNNVAAVAKSQGDYAEAETLYRQALDMQRELLDEDHPEVAAAHNNLASIVERRGDHVAAEKLLRDALAIYRRQLEPDHPKITSTLNNLANVLRTKGDFAESRRMFEESLELLRTRLGDKHMRVAAARNNLAGLLRTMGDLDAAADAYEEVLRVLRELVGDEHEYVATTLNNLATIEQMRGNRDAAEQIFREALARWRKMFGDEHQQVAAGLQNLAAVLADKGEHEVAEALFREALAMRRKLLGDKHPEVAITLDNLGSLLQDAGDFVAAETLHLEALAIRRVALGPRNPSVAHTLYWLGQVRLRCKDPGRAESYVRDALEIYNETLSENHVRVINSERLLGRCLTARGQFEQAEAILLDNHRKVGDSPETIEALVDLYDAWGKIERATEWRANLRAALPTDAPPGP